MSSLLTFQRRTRALAVAALLTALGSLAAGGSADAAAPPTLSFTLNPAAITLSGSPQSGGVNLVTTATGTKEAALVVVQLKPGVTVEQLYAYLASNKATADPNTVSKFGAIVFDAEAPVGKSEAQTELQPGTYVALNGEGEKSAAWKHTSFTVQAASAPVALPPAQAVMRTIDFGFRGPSTLHVGELVRFENEGYVVHMDFGFPVASKKAAAKVAHALLTGKEKQAEKLVAGQPVSFAGPLSSGAFQQETITAKPGWYVITCFMATQDGRVHTRLGMERVIKIVK